MAFEASKQFLPNQKNETFSVILHNLFHLATPTHTCSSESCYSIDEPKQNIKRPQCWRNVCEHFQHSFTALLNTLVRKYFQSFGRVSAKIISRCPVRCSSSVATFLFGEYVSHWDCKVSWLVVAEVCFFLGFQASRFPVKGVGNLRRRSISDL